MRHIVSIKQFDKQQLAKLFAVAKRLQLSPPWAVPQPLKGRVIATLFYESSTRTRLSFESAVLRLGGGILSTDNAQEVLSSTKGESLADTIRIIGGYADAIVLRHPEAGAAERAAKVSPVPIINAGDGSGEHPTQALLDIYTMQQHKTLNNMVVGLAGDLRGSRTLHSLLLLLINYPIHLRLIAPKGFDLPPELMQQVEQRNVSWAIERALQPVLPRLDVLYINRWQSERYRGAKSKVLGPALREEDLVLLKHNAVIMNPLPRVSEVDAAVDADPRAIYFEQAKNGLYVRMALLSRLFDND